MTGAGRCPGGRTAEAQEGAGFSRRAGRRLRRVNGALLGPARAAETPLREDAARLTRAVGKAASPPRGCLQPSNPLLPAGSRGDGRLAVDIRRRVTCRGIDRGEIAPK